MAKKEGINEGRKGRKEREMEKRREGGKKEDRLFSYVSISPKKSRNKGKIHCKLFSGECSGGGEMINFFFIYLYILFVSMILCYFFN